MSINYKYSKYKTKYNNLKMQMQMQMQMGGDINQIHDFYAILRDRQLLSFEQLGEIENQIRNIPENRNNMSVEEFITIISRRLNIDIDFLREIASIMNRTQSSSARHQASASASARPQAASSARPLVMVEQTNIERISDGIKCTLGDISIYIHNTKNQFGIYGDINNSVLYILQLSNNIEEPIIFRPNDLLRAHISEFFKIINDIINYLRSHNLPNTPPEQQALILRYLTNLSSQIKIAINAPAPAPRPTPRPRPQAAAVVPNGMPLNDALEIIIREAEIDRREALAQRPNIQLRPNAIKVSLGQLICEISIYENIFSIFCIRNDNIVYSLRLSGVNEEPVIFRTNPRINIYITEFFQILNETILYLQSHDIPNITPAQKALILRYLTNLSSQITPRN